MPLTRAAQPWFRVDVVFKLLADGTTTKTMKFINRSAKGESTLYWPLLKSIDGCGLEVGQDGMPVQSTGTINIVDPFESLGEERRAFDILERYTPVNQSVSVYAAQTPVSDTAPDADFALIWKGVCRDVSKAFDEESTLSFAVESVTVNERTWPLRIDEGIKLASNDLISVPDQSYGRALPLVFGNTTPLFSW